MTFWGSPMKTVAWVITEDLSQHHSEWMEMFRCGKEVVEILPIDLTLLGTYWWGAESDPPASFSALYGKRLKMGSWNFLTFSIHSLGMLYQILEFLFFAEAPPGPLSRGHACQVSTIFFSFSETVKIWLRVMDLLIEKLVLKFDPNRSRNNDVITFLNIWWKNGDFYFWPLNSNFAYFWGFRKRIL